MALPFKDLHFYKHASDPFWTVHAIPVRIRFAIFFWGEGLCDRALGDCSPRGLSHFMVFRTKHLCAQKNCIQTKSDPSTEMCLVSDVTLYNHDHT